MSNICLGTDNYGNAWGCDEPTAHKILGMALDGGINFVDTSDSYNEGRSESMIGNYLTNSRRRNNVVLATKYRSAVGAGVNDIGASRYHIVRAVEESLRRLRTDRIDLLYCHSWDEETPIEETLRAVDDLIHQGKVVYAGASNFPAWVLARSLWASDVRNLYRFEAIQSVFNILQPGLGREMIPFAADHELAVIPYSPLASGYLSGKYRNNQMPKGTRIERDGEFWTRYNKHNSNKAVDAYYEISKKHGLDLAQMSLKFLEIQPFVTSVIIGATTMKQLKTNVESVNIDLTDEVIKEINEVQTIYPNPCP